MAAPEKLGLEPHVGVSVDLADSQVEALGRDAIGGIQDGGEHDALVAALEEAYEGWIPVVGAEAGGELGVDGDVAPPLADRGGAGKGGGLRRDAEQDLAEDVVVFERRRRCRRRAAAAAAAAARARHGRRRGEGDGKVERAGGGGDQGRRHFLRRPGSRCRWTREECGDV